MRFTDEQTEAIDRRQGSLFLHAGAGSGKTRVLVERFVRSVRDDEVAVDRILAITFTEKAAAELKTRIRRRFLDLGERERAREAEGAWVSTIHGFCARLLRTHPLPAGIDPEFRVLDDAAASRLAVDAFDAALEGFLRSATRGERIDLVASYTPDKLQGMVRTVYSRLRSRGERVPKLPPIEQPRPGEERARLERAVRAAQSELAGADVNKTVTSALAQLEGCSEALAKLPDGELGEAADFKELTVKRGNAKALKGDVFDELEEAEGAWIGACNAKKAYADYVLLAKLLELYGTHYGRLKDERSSLDFEDLELRGRDLLKREPALRNGLRARFEQVMVDEYQDTNPLQNELIDLLSDDNLFTVGDEFQSIYGFRNADVEVFRKRRDAAAEANATARLATNFRSAPELLDVLNAAFEDVWGDGYTPLAPSPEAPRDEPGAEPRVELLLVDKEKKRWEEALGEDAFGEGSEVTPWRMAEARLLAARVDELVSSGRFAAGDVAVLLRSARDMPAYERALSDRGLPTYAHGGGGYWDQQQIGDLRAYLAALANPHDEEAMYNVLASPLVGATLDTLVLLQMRARELRRSIWWTLEEAFGPDGDGSDGFAEALPERDRPRVAAFVERFGAERLAAPRLSLETLIDRAVTGSGYDRAILALAHGDRRLANVRKLMRLAREFERDNGRDLRRFIDYVDERQLLQSREGEAPLAGEGLAAVRLMTVHAAKGLEFPLVCVADLGRAARDDYGPLQVSRDGEIGLEVASLGGGRTSTREMDKIKEARAAEAEEEEKRIFYVAMTRAERHLIVSGATDTVKWPEPKPLGAPMDWVLPALAPDARLIWERDAEGLDGRGVRCVKLTPEVVDEVLPPADRAPVAAAVDVDAPEFERPSFAPVADGVSLPVARLSYSAVESYKRCGYRFYVERVVGMRRPEALQVVDSAENGSGDGQLALGEAAPAGAVELSPLLRGTVVHELLEQVDFSRPAAPSDDAVAERIRAHGATADDAAVADARRLIEGFVASDLCARLSAAARVRLELPFAFGLEPPGLGGQSLLINGVVDVHAEEADRTLVVDYKTDSLQGRDPADACEEKYATQRVVYALAALRSGAETVEVIYVFLERPDAPVATTFTAADAPRLESELLELAGGVISGRFEPTEEPHRELCHMCPAQPALCKWGPDRTLADRPEGETIGGAEPVDVAEGLVG